MSIMVDIDSRMQAFLAGRLPFDRLTEALRQIARDDPSAVLFLDAAVRDLVNTGRLPADLGILIQGAVAMPAAEGASTAGPAAALDPPTRPRATPGGAPAPDPAAGDSARDTVERAVISGFVEDYRKYRDRSGPTARSPDSGLDDQLAAFRGMRFRRDAENAAGGQPRGAQPKRSFGRYGDARIGRMLKDRFILDKELGRGGMGTVFQAVDRRRLEARHAQPYVAIKLISADFQSHPEAARALEAETRKTQELAHPNIVTVYDFDRDGDDVFIVMELLRGKPLDALLRDAPQGRPGTDLAARVVEGLCRGLSYAHERGIIHADIKPSNLFVLDNGGVKLLDFGIASAIRGSGLDIESLDGLTLSYASPELLDGAQRDPRDDIYALGCLTYLMLTGNRPYGREISNVARDREMKLERPRGLGGGPWRAVHGALTFDRDRRTATAEQFRGLYFGRTLTDRLLGQ